MTVTADMASDWLTSRNHPKNRPISAPVAGKYQRDMAHKLWHRSPAPIVFTKDGYLIDGQHRLKAQANAGITLAWKIEPGWDFEVYRILDSGFKRSAAHMLQNTTQPGAVANAARYMAALSDNDRWGIPRYGRVTTAEILQVAATWPELTWYEKEVKNIYRATRLPLGVHMAVLAQAARTVHIGKIKGWLDGLYNGSNLEIGDPRLTLRNRYATGYRPMTHVPIRDLHYGQVVKAWNAFAEDRQLTLLRVTVGEPLPRVTGFDWADPPERA